MIGIGTGLWGLNTRRAFTPRQLSGCVLWLRADLGLSFGGMGRVTSGGTTPPSMTVAGVPNGPHVLRVEITAGGALGAATYRASINGGSTWSYSGATAAAVPLSGSGLTLVFPSGTYAADNYWTANAAVGTWSDQSGLSHSVSQGALSSAPRIKPTDAQYGGATVLDFSGSAFMQSGIWGAPLTQPCCVYIVGNVATTSTAASYLLDSQSATQRIAMGAQPGPTNAHMFGGITLQSSVNLSVPSIMVAVFNGASSALYVNSRTAAVAGDAGSQRLDALTVGSFYAATNYYGNGRVAEAFMVQGATSFNPKAVSYLSQRYSISFS